MKPAVIQHEADAELVEAMNWYDEKESGLGAELLSEVRGAVERIENNPGIGARYRNTVFRFYRVKRFPYLIYYEEFADHLWVIAIAHKSRRPGYWRRRKHD